MITRLLDAVESGNFCHDTININMLSGFGCCFRGGKLEQQGTAEPGNKENSSCQEDVDVDVDVEATGADITNDQRNYYEFLAPSVHHLQTSFLEYVEDSGFGSDSKIYDIEDLRSTEPGLIRRKGLKTVCPIDGRVGASYVHCIEGDDHVGTATHMLSYAWVRLACASTY